MKVHTKHYTLFFSKIEKQREGIQGNEKPKKSHTAGIIFYRTDIIWMVCMYSIIKDVRNTKCNYTVRRILIRGRV